MSGTEPPKCSYKCIKNAVFIFQNRHYSKYRTLMRTIELVIDL